MAWRSRRMPLLPPALAGTASKDPPLGILAFRRSWSAKTRSPRDGASKHRRDPEPWKRRARSVVIGVMLSRTEPLSVAPDVTPLIRPSRISAQLRVQGRISLSEVLSALSCALDLTEGAPAGHTMRTCLIGMRLAEAIGIDAEQRSALYYALLLKDAGCSSNAGRMAALFGADDQAVKPRMKLVDWHARARLAVETALTVAPGGSLLERARQFF